VLAAERALVEDPPELAIPEFTEMCIPLPPGQPAKGDCDWSAPDCADVDAALAMGDTDAPGDGVGFVETCAQPAAPTNTTKPTPIASACRTRTLRRRTPSRTDG
jgi:hypothetical protein